MMYTFSSYSDSCETIANMDNADDESLTGILAMQVYTKNYMIVTCLPCIMI